MKYFCWCKDKLRTVPRLRVVGSRGVTVYIYIYIYTVNFHPVLVTQCKNGRFGTFWLRFSHLSRISQTYWEHYDCQAEIFTSSQLPKIGKNLKDSRDSGDLFET